MQVTTVLNNIMYLLITYPATCIHAYIFTRQEEAEAGTY